jgi:putative transposase
LNGEIKWRGKLVYLNCALAGEPVGLAEDTHRWTVSFGPVVLGSLAHGGDRLCKPKPCGLVDNAARCPQGPQSQQQQQN